MLTRRVTAGVVMLVGGLVMTALAQSPRQRPVATGLLMGRVIDVATGAPVRGAAVRLHDWSADDGEDPKTAVITGADGQFVFGGVAEGDYRLWASKFGYSDSTIGQRRPHPDFRGVPPTHLESNEHRDGLTIRLWKHAAISGRVVDEYGEPLTGVKLQAFPREFIGGRVVLGERFAVETRSDDRGRYRLANLAAGDYIVGIVRSQGSASVAFAAENRRLAQAGDESAMMQTFIEIERAGLDMPRLGESSHIQVGSWLLSTGRPPSFIRDGRVFVYPSQFHGGQAEAAAKPIVVRPGDEIDGIDFTMRPTMAARVSGTVSDASGPVAGVPVRMTPADAGAFEHDNSAPGSVCLTDAAGRFTLFGVTPGDYRVLAVKGPARTEGFGVVEAMGASNDGSVVSVGGGFEMFKPPTPAAPVPTLAASSTVTIGTADVDNVSLLLRNGVRLAGRIEYSGTGDRPDARSLERFSVRAQLRDHAVPFADFDTAGKLGADGKFETAELPPGAYLLRVSEVPPGWHLESIDVDGVDASVTAIDVGDKPIGSIVVRFIDKPARLAGSVRLPNGVRPEDAMVVVFPADRSRWVDYGVQPRSLRESSVSADGAFSIDDLPAGAYMVAALQDDFVTDWHDPAFLTKIVSLGTRVTLGRSEQKVIGLDVRRLR